MVRKAFFKAHYKQNNVSTIESSLRRFAGPAADSGTWSGNYFPLRVSIIFRAIPNQI